jgi:hypothetical protein
MQEQDTGGNYAEQKLVPTVEDLARLQSESLAELRKVSHLFGQVLQDTTLNVVGQGFQGLSNDLAVLRDFTPRRQQMSDEQIDRLRALRESLQRPEWGNISAMPVDQQPVPFIGTTAPPRPPTAFTKAGA